MSATTPSDASNPGGATLGRFDRAFPETFRAGASRPVIAELWSLIRSWVENNRPKVTFDVLAVDLWLDRAGVARGVHHGRMSLEFLVFILAKYGKGFEHLPASREWPNDFCRAMFGYMEAMSILKSPQRRYFARHYAHPIVVAYLYILHAKYRKRDELLKWKNDPLWRNDTWWRTPTHHLAQRLYEEAQEKVRSVKPSIGLLNDDKWCHPPTKRIEIATVIHEAIQWHPMFSEVHSRTFWIDHDRFLGGAE